MSKFECTENSSLHQALDYMYIQSAIVYILSYTQIYSTCKHNHNNNFFIKCFQDRTLLSDPKCEVKLLYSLGDAYLLKVLRIIVIDTTLINYESLEYA